MLDRFLDENAAAASCPARTDEQRRVTGHILPMAAYRRHVLKQLTSLISGFGVRVSGGAPPLTSGNRSDEDRRKQPLKDRPVSSVGNVRLV